MTRRMPGEGTIHRRKQDGRYVGQIDVGWVGGKRKRKTVYGHTQIEVRDKLKAARREIEAGNMATTSLTVQKWLDYWLDNIAAQSVKPRTLLTYRAYVKKWLVPALGKKRLDKLSQAHVRELHAFMRSEKVSETTVHHAHRVLTNALNVALQEGRVVRNVAARGAPRQAVNTRQALSAADARKVLEVAGSDRMTTRWWAALLTGARQGELLGLRWSHVDLELGVIDLAWSLQRVPYIHGCGGACGKKKAVSCPDKTSSVPGGIPSTHLTGNLYLLPPKTSGSTRVVPLLPEMVAALRIHRAATSKEPNPYDLVWRRKDGHPIADREDWRAWRDLLEKAKVAPVSLHEARNTTASLLLELGVDIRVIAQILGHSNVVMTRSYQRVPLELSRSAVEQLGGLLGLPAGAS